MPELPEVEVSARIASRALKGRSISQVELKDCKLYRLPQSQDRDVSKSRMHDIEQVADVERLKSLLVGARSVPPHTLRYGKLMALTLESSEGGALCLFARLGMTGKFVSRALDIKTRSSAKLTLTLCSDTADELCLDFLNTRMFGALWASYSKSPRQTRSLPERLQTLFELECEQSQMGPDALQLCQDQYSFKERLRQFANSRRVKNALLDQALLAGVGNIYAVEGLFAARAYPLKKISELSDKQLFDLADGISTAMNRTLKDFDANNNEIIYDSARGSDSSFAVYGREGLPCHKCQSLLDMIRVSGRATVFCPSCQS